MVYRLMILLAKLLGVALIVIMAVFLLPLVVPQIKDAESFRYIQKALNLEKTISSFVQTIIPTTIAGRNMTRWIVLAAAFILGLSLIRATKFFRNRIDKLKFKQEYDTWKSKYHLSDGTKVLTPLKEKMDKLETSSHGEREELLRLFAETKKKLDAMGRDLAFLSIDVVDSTGLKEGEDRAAIEYDFKEYKKFVNSRLTDNSVVKSTWTPDGVMCCFSSVEAAVKAAREIIEGLDAFNKHVKTARKDFRVRCGINAGYVYFDESVPLEEMADHVIDVAGHMQKYAAPGSIYISKNIIKPLQETSQFIPISKVVDGYEVYMFERRKTPRE